MKSGLRRAVLAIAFASVPGVVGVASAQGDLKARTLSITRTGTVGADGTATYTGTQFGGVSGFIDTHAIPGANLRPYFVFTNVSSSISGFTDPMPSGVWHAVLATFSFGGHFRASGLLPNGFADDEDGFTGQTIPFLSTDPYSFGGSIFLNLTGQGPGARATGTVIASLAGADAISQSGQVIGSVVFDDQGNGILVASTVPEPTSLALLGTGLVGLVPLVRRRKRAA